MIQWTFQDAMDQDHPYHSVHIKFLYDLLKERMNAPDTNISHISMPTYKQHVTHVALSEHKFWDIIVNIGDPTDCIGSLYVTKNNEIGIHICEKYQKKGIGFRALNMIFESYPNEKFYANINPKNIASIKLFEKFGFKLIQQTYLLPERVSQIEYEALQGLQLN